MQLSEIEAYCRLYSIPDTERFADLLLGADSAVFEAIRDVQERKRKMDKLKKLKG